MIFPAAAPLSLTKERVYEESKFAYDTLMQEMGVALDIMEGDSLWTLRSWQSCIQKFWEEGDNAQNVKEIYWTINSTISFIKENLQPRFEKWNSLIWTLLCNQEVMIEIMEQEAADKTRQAEEDEEEDLDTNVRPQLTADIQEDEGYEEVLSAIARDEMEETERLIAQQESDLKRRQEIDNVAMG